MKLHKPSGLWFPDTESHPQKMYDGLMKYIDDPKFFLSLFPERKKKQTVVQAGGHIGVWPLMLAKHFGRVITFEPDPPVFNALVANVKDVPNIAPYWGALGEEPGTRTLSYYSNKTAVSTMAETGWGNGDMKAEVDVYTIDDFREPIHAIVLDVEGYEPWVLRGARKTIKRYKPLILCEMLKRSSEAITETMKEMGYLPVVNKIHPKCRDTIFAYGGLE